VAVIQSLLWSAGFFFQVRMGSPEGPHESILIRVADLPAIKALLDDYRTSGIARHMPLAAMLLCMSACSLGLAQPRVTAGKWFPEAELTRIQRGASTADVQRIAGAPLETTKTSDGERWRYSMTVEQKEHVKLLGVIPLPPRRSVRTFEVVFLIRNGRVADVTSRDSVLADRRRTCRDAASRGLARWRGGLTPARGGPVTTGGPPWTRLRAAPGWHLRDGAAPDDGRCLAAPAGRGDTSPQSRGLAT
jgi:hypothetical protein